LFFQIELVYRYATQPLPTPLAWYAHHFVHPELLKAGVAFTLAAEVGALYKLRMQLTHRA
jgi:hypothetical protein